MRAFYHIMVIIIILFSSVPAVMAASTDIKVTPLNAFTETGPRRPITLIAEVENISTRELCLIPTLDLPNGWLEVLPVKSTHLAPGEIEKVLFTLLPSATVPAGDYTIKLEYNGGELLSSASAKFNVRITAKSDLDISILNDPRYAVSGEPYTIQFLVRNSGNIIRNLHLQSLENLGIQVELDKTNIELPPGDSVVITMTVSMNKHFNSVRLHRPELVVTDEADPGFKAKASVRVELIPSSISNLSAYHQFPLRLTLGVGTDLNNLTFSRSLYGKGRLSHTDPGEFSIFITEDKQFASYTAPTFRISAGDQGFYLSNLTLAGISTQGVKLSVDLNSLSAQVFGYKGNTGIHTGLRLTYCITDKVEAALNYFKTPQPGGSFISLESNINFSDQITASLEYGVQGGSSDFRESRALQFSGIFVTENSATMGTWQRTDPGYRSEPKALNILRINHRTNIGTIRLSLTGRYRSRYSDGFNSNIDRLETYLGGSLRGPVGTGSWSIDTHRNKISYPLEKGDTVSQGIFGGFNQYLSKSHLLSLRIGVSHKYGTETGDKDLKVPFRLSYSLPLYKGTLRSYIVGKCILGEDTDNPLGAGVEWCCSTKDLKGSMRLEAIDFNKHEYMVQGDLGYTLPIGHSLTAQAKYAWLGEKISFGINLGYTIPIDFSIPLGLHSNVGVVEGRIVDEQNNGVEGLLIYLNGDILRTQEDGSFRFPAVVEGDVVITVAPEEIGPEYILLPVMPYKIKVVAGETTKQEFQMVKAARLDGLIEISLPSVYTRTVGTVFGDRPGSLIDPSILNGIVIELSKDGESYRQAIQVAKQSNRNSNESGNNGASFRFDQVLPGVWTLTVHRNSLPDIYEIEVITQAVTLEPGETANIIIKVIPKERKVKFIDSNHSTILSVPINGGWSDNGEK